MRKKMAIRILGVLSVCIICFVVFSVLTRDKGTSGELNGGYHVSINRARLGRNPLDALCIFVSYEFSHTNDEPTSFFYSISPEAFQNGVECQRSFFGDSDTVRQEIEKDVTIRVEIAYELNNMNTPVNIEVLPLGNTAFITPRLSKTFDLSVLQ